MIKTIVLTLTLCVSVHAFAEGLRLGPEVPVSPAPIWSQSSIAIAEGWPVFAAWLENNSNVMTALGGVVTSQMPIARNSTITLAVARGGETFLVVWDRDDFTVVARRYSVDGRPLDREPIVIARTSSPVPQVNAAWNGTTYLVVWSDVSLRARRLREDGMLTEGSFVVMNAPVGEFPVHPRVASGGNSFVVAALGYIPILVNPGEAPRPTRIWFADVAADGASSAVSSPLFIAEPGAEFNTTGLGITVGNGQPTIVWADKRAVDLSSYPWITDACIHAVQPPAPPRTLRCLGISPFEPMNGDFTSVDVAWNGSEYVVVWNRLGTAYAERFDGDLKSIDAAPIEVAWNTAISAIQVARSDDAVTIAYTRTDAGPHDRAFVRTLKVSDEPLPPRRRGVRH